MEGTLIDWDMEKISENLGKMQSVENVKEDPLMEQMESLWMEYF